MIDILECFLKVRDWTPADPNVMGVFRDQIMVGPSADLQTKYKEVHPVLWRWEDDDPRCFICVRVVSNLFTCTSRFFLSSGIFQSRLVIFVLWFVLRSDCKISFLIVRHSHELLLRDPMGFIVFLWLCFFVRIR